VNDNPRQPEEPITLARLSQTRARLRP